MPRKARADAPNDVPRLRLLNAARLREHALPPLNESGSKEDRGRVLVVGGTRQTSGAVALAAVAALRAGAGKVQVATARSAVPLVAPLLPEALLIELPEGRNGGPSGRGLSILLGLAERADALCIGPGLLDEAAARRMLEALTDAARGTWVIDAAAIPALGGRGAHVLKRLGSHAVLTPHAGEMAGLLGTQRRRVEEMAVRMACEFSGAHGCTLVLKGAETVIAASGHQSVFLNRRGNVGLATAGSGDVLAGLVAGCAARGASGLSAALHGVHAHAVAGERLTARLGAAGYLARELLDELPRILFPPRGAKRT